MQQNSLDSLTTEREAVRAARAPAAEHANSTVPFDCGESSTW